MNTQVRHENGVAVIAATGSVDALTADELHKIITGELTNEHANVVIDLTEVEFMSSAGLRMLLLATKEARIQGGDLRVASNNPGIDKLLAMSGFVSIARVFASAQDAVLSFAQQA